ncbi:TolA-binding protein [Sphingomonas sp. UYAg733]
MKKITILIASLGFAATALPVAASAAPAWQTINHRQANLYNRIDQGIRSGALNRAEATRLKTQFRQLNNLEAQYRRSRPGLTIAERRDLDRRFDTLSQRIKIQKHDRQGRRY